MKTVKLITGIMVLLVFLNVDMSYGQWATNGSNIYNTNAGNVGIGINTPGYLLHVSRNMTSPSIRIQNSGGTGGAAFEMIDNLSGADWKFKATTTGGFKIRDHAYGLDVIQVEPNSSANALYINGSGYVGLGTNAPSYKLDVQGDGQLYDYYPFLFLNASGASENIGLNFEVQGSNRAFLYFNDNLGNLVINADNGGGWREDLIIKSDGRVSIGSSNAAAGYSLSVAGKVACTEVLVEATENWPDYVFEESYELLSLRELKQSISENKHLPGIPSAGEIMENGFQLGEMQCKFLEKIEEMTLYMIKQDEQISALQEKVAALEEEINSKSRK